MFRAVNPLNVDWENLDEGGYPALQSNVFQHMSEKVSIERGYPSPAMSVVLSHVLDLYDEPKECVLDRFTSDWGIASITVGEIRSVNPGVGVCENPVDDAPWHGLVFALTRKMMKKPESGGLRDRAKLVTPPSRVA